MSDPTTNNTTTTLANTEDIPREALDLRAADRHLDGDVLP